MPILLFILEVNCLRLAQAAAVSNARLVTGAKTKAAPHLVPVKSFVIVKIAKQTIDLLILFH